MADPTTEQHTASAPSGADYFSVFSLPRRLGLDTAALERAFHKRSREVHPDRFARKSPEEQQWSLEQTSLLNDAYRALKEPISRTEYLLRLEGITVADEPAGSDARAEKKNAPPELLAEVFELNMQLEELRMNAQMGEDDPQLRADLEAARQQFEGQLRAIEKQIESEGAQWDAALDAGDEAGKKKTLDGLAALLDKRRYVRNLVRDVREALGA